MNEMINGGKDNNNDISSKVLNFLMDVTKGTPHCLIELSLHEWRVHRNNCLSVNGMIKEKKGQT